MRKGEDTGAGIGSVLGFLDSRLGDAATYGGDARVALSLGKTDTSAEGLARTEEYLQRDREILEQWKREQAENGN
jgi:hypothetical protein